MNEEATPLFAGELAARPMKTSIMIDALVPSHYMLGLWIMLDGFGLTEVGLDWMVPNFSWTSIGFPVIGFLDVNPISGIPTPMPAKHIFVK